MFKKRLLFFSGEKREIEKSKLIFKNENYEKLDENLERLRVRVYGHSKYNSFIMATILLFKAEPISVTFEKELTIPSFLITKLKKHSKKNIRNLRDF